MSDSGYTPTEVHVAKVIANAACDWVDVCNSDDHALEHSNWESYIPEARVIVVQVRADQAERDAVKAEEFAASCERIGQLGAGLVSTDKIETCGDG